LIRIDLATLAGHTGSIWGAAFSGDGRSIASGGADGVLRLWDDGHPAPVRNFRADRPYERMDITGLTGVTAAQHFALVELGSVDRRQRAQSDGSTLGIPTARPLNVNGDAVPA